MSKEKINELFLITAERKLYKAKLRSCHVSLEEVNIALDITAGGEIPDGLLKMKDLSREYSLAQDSGIIFEN